MTDDEADPRGQAVRCALSRFDPAAMLSGRPEGAAGRGRASPCTMALVTIRQIRATLA